MKNFGTEHFDLIKRDCDLFMVCRLHDGTENRGSVFKIIFWFDQNYIEMANFIWTFKFLYFFHKMIKFMQEMTQKSQTREGATAYHDGEILVRHLGSGKREGSNESTAEEGQNCIRSVFDGKNLISLIGLNLQCSYKKRDMHKT